MKAWIFIALLSAPHLAKAAPVQRFALIVGHNRSLNPDNPPLAYADDDALRAAEVLGTFMPSEHITLLVEADRDSRKLFGEAAARAQAPTLARFHEAIEKLAARLRAARQGGARTEVYFIYGGHGDVKDGQAFIDLLDGRLSAKDLEQALILALPADRLHLIVDSCNSYYLLSPRAPGGRRYSLPPERVLSFFERHPHVGVFLSTSAANEVYEWSELQSGIFSHEVRSGLLGAADLNGDQQVSYTELEAFVRVANQDLVNERYRPRIFARAPTADGVLAPLGEGGMRLPNDAAGRFFIEDDRGLRVAEFHKARGQALQVTLPKGPRRYFLRRIRGRLGGEEGPSAVEELTLNQSANGVVLAANAVPLTARGAESTVFKALFLSPFSAQVAAQAARKAPPAGGASAAHGPTFSVSVESGHLAGMRLMTLPALGYRYARDRVVLRGAASLWLCAQQHRRGASVRCVSLRASARASV